MSPASILLSPEPGIYPPLPPPAVEHPWSWYHSGEDDQDEESEEEEDEWSLSKTSLTSFWCSMTKGEKDWLKALRPSSFMLCPENLSIFCLAEIYLFFSVSNSSGLGNNVLCENYMLRPVICIWCSCAMFYYALFMS
jgi:hypothetical protein